jgi:hypothetical protein
MLRVGFYISFNCSDRMFILLLMLRVRFTALEAFEWAFAASGVGVISTFST